MNDIDELKIKLADIILSEYNITTSFEGFEILKNEHKNRKIKNICKMINELNYENIYYEDED